MSGRRLEALLKRDRLLVAACLVLLFGLAWAFLFQVAADMSAMQGIAARMMGMRVEDGVSNLLALAFSPATAAFADSGYTFVLVALMWAVMMVGMMLPSAAPTILLFAALERKARPDAPFGRTAFFTAGYLIAWGGFSIAAAAAQAALSNGGLLDMNMASTSALLGGGILVLAGLFEFTPLKNRCLSHCRSPLEWLPRHWRPGKLGALRMGAEHGIYCIGCCWMLMLLLFVGGVMNLLWVALVALVVLAEKLLPRGPLTARLAGSVLIACGLVVAFRGM